MWIKVHIYSVKAKSQAGNIWVKDIMTIQKGQSHKMLSLRILKNYAFCQKIQQRASGSGESTTWGCIAVYKNTPE